LYPHPPSSIQNFQASLPSVHIFRASLSSVYTPSRFSHHCPHLPGNSAICINKASLQSVCTPLSLSHIFIHVFRANPHLRSHLQILSFISV
jgi:hypothetical protein